MPKAKNRVIAGNYKGKPVKISLGSIRISGMLIDVKIDRKTVAHYEIIDDEIILSTASGLVRSLLGGAAFGGPGMIIGGLTAKTWNIYQIAIEFNDGKRSLIEVDDKIYKQILKKCF